MILRLPDGTPIMHTDENGIRHAYDPVYARQYYLRTRKLKGRKKKAAVAKAPEKANQKKYRAALDKFLSRLPMAVEGADLKTVEAFVDSMRGKSDAQLKAEAARIKRENGNNDGARVATIEALLKNRERVRKNKADAKRNAQKKGSSVQITGSAKKS